MTNAKKEKLVMNSSLNPKSHNTSVKGVTIHSLPYFEDYRGSLNVFDFFQDLPFVPVRSFVTYNVANSEIRGEHAHRSCKQFLICIRGELSVVVTDGKNTEEIRLNSPSLGVYMPPMIWGTQSKYTADAMLLVFASEKYEHNEYIRSFEEYLKLIADG